MTRRHDADALAAPSVVEGRVEAVLADGRVALRLAHATRVFRLAPTIDLVEGDLVRARVLGERLDAVLGRARPRGERPFADDELRRLSAPSMRAALERRVDARRAARATLDARGFLEVETPSVMINPGMDPHLNAPEVLGFGGPHAMWLGTSPEFHMKRLLAAGHGRIYQLARCYRAGERGSRHQPEFTMLEWYRSWDSLQSVMDDAAALVRAVCDTGDGPVARRHGRSVPLDAPFEALTIREAFARYCPEVGDPVALAERDEETYYGLLGERIEPRLGWDGGVFLTRFPACHASLARLCDDDPSVCHRAELYVAGLELCNAFDELTDPEEQRARFEADQRARAARGLPVHPIDEPFMRALELAMPPSAGNALGFDRLLMLACGAERIDDVLAFPH
ncbi:MAG: EF-P lysine aminoacylase EpmA [Polyangiales bacterium]